MVFTDSASRPSSSPRCAGTRVSKRPAAMSPVARVRRTTVRVMLQMNGHHSSADSRITSTANSSHSMTPRKCSRRHRLSAVTVSITGRCEPPGCSTSTGMRRL